MWCGWATGLSHRRSLRIQDKPAYEHLISAEFRIRHRQVISSIASNMDSATTEWNRMMTTCVQKKAENVAHAGSLNGKVQEFRSLSEFATNKLDAISFSKM